MIELIKKAKEGDEEAFSELICLKRHNLYKIARTRLSNNDDIEDAIQETIIETFKSIKKLKNEQAFNNWIIKVLINKCNRIYRNNNKNKISYEKLELDDFYICDNKNDLEGNMDFFYMLDGLNYDERIVIILFYMEDYSIKEISKILNVKENTLKTRLRRAKEKIKNKFEGSQKDG